MRPYNHLQDLDPGLIRFAIYLRSQGWQYEIFAPDYDSPSGEIWPVNSRFSFRFNSQGLIRYENVRPYQKTIFNHMPVREEIFG